jgi:hypothetical protein
VRLFVNNAQSGPTQRNDDVFNRQQLMFKMPTAPQSSTMGLGIATASLIDTWIEEAERRAWFRLESSPRRDGMGH